MVDDYSASDEEKPMKKVALTGMQMSLIQEETDEYFSSRHNTAVELKTVPASGKMKQGIIDSDGIKP